MKGVQNVSGQIYREASPAGCIVGGGRGGFAGVQICIKPNLPLSHFGKGSGGVQKSKLLKMS